MKRFSLTALALVILLATSTTATAIEWFQGGTLHRATYAQWNSASYENKLATASDWLASTKWKGHLNTPNDFARLKVKAGMLAKGLDEVTTIEGMGSLKVNEAAAMVIMIANDLDP